jgi:dTDP-glucose 4,6-dehydratase
MNGLSQRDLDEMLDGTEEVWRSLRGARVFLTGATGFYGVWLLSAFAHARLRLGLDIALTVLTRSPEGARDKHGALLAAAGASLHAGDVRTFGFPKGAFSHVIHGATSASAQLNTNAPHEMFDIIIDGTKRTLAFAKQAGCERFSLMSSGAIYGPQPSDVTHVPEHFGGGPDPLNVANAYAEGKRAAELVSAIEAKASGFALTVARGFAFVGPHLPLDTHFAIGNFLRDAMAGDTIRILGDGTPYRSYLYGTDLAAWIWTIAVKGRAGAAYNVGSDDGRPLKDVAACVARATGVSVDIAKTAPEGVAPARYVPDVSLARTELGLVPRVGLEDAIERTLAFYRSV